MRFLAAMRANSHGMELAGHASRVLDRGGDRADRERHRKGAMHLTAIRLAQVLKEMPASEAAAERASSVFEFFDKSRMAAGMDLIQVELMFRFWRINHPLEKPFWTRAKRE